MKGIADISVRRPITTGMVLVSVLVLGVIAFTRLPLAFFPDLDFPARNRLRDGLVVAEVALAFVLLTGAGLTFRSYTELKELELGYDQEHVLSAILLIPGASYPKLAERRVLLDSVLSRVRALPGVASAACVLMRPFEGETIGWNSPLLLEGQPLERSYENPSVNFEAITPEYFRTMGIPLLEGRDFSADDTDDVPRVAIVSGDLADRLWPGESALGQRLWTVYASSGHDEDGGLRYQTVVGVVAEASYRGILSPQLDFYAPYRQSQPLPTHVVVRTAVGLDTLAPLLREQIRRVDPAIVVEGMTTLENIVHRQYLPWRFNAELFSFLGVTAVALAAVGLFALLAIAVRERTREIGIRAAMGATRITLLATFLRRGLVLAGAGAALGIVGSLVLTRYIRSFLYGVDVVDVTTLTLVVGIVLSTALLASFIPAERASRISPAQALRHE